MKAELIDYFGNDLMVVNAARVSYDKYKESFSEKDIRLIKFLVDHKHTSPFRHPQLQFRVECPIFVERQLFKHQVGLTANCLASDVNIKFIKNSGGILNIPISDLYYKWTNGRSHQNTEKDMQYTRKRIQSMKVRVLDESNGQFTFGHIKNVFKSGVKDVYEIKTENGEFIKCSHDHKIWTDKGWSTINSGLSIGTKIGLNGIQAAGDGSYRIKSNLEKDRLNKLSISEMSIKYNCSYHTIRKWLKIHNLSFSREETCFKYDHIPWNKGIYGYNINISEIGMNSRIKYCEEKSLNRYKNIDILEINKDDKIAFNLFAKRFLKRNNIVYSEDLECEDLEVHHIIPFRVDNSLYFDINNVILISKKRHEYIHSNWQNELEFARKFYSDDFLKNMNFQRSGNMLRVHFDQIISIKYIGKEETFDIEMNGPHHNFVANNIVVHNSISGRYVDFSDSYSLPTELRLQSKDSKQGSDGILNNSSELIAKINKLVDDCSNLYEELCNNGVAKEQARIILPLCLNTKFIWTGSLAAFLHLFNLRCKPDAQKETRELAFMMLEEIRNIPGEPFKYTLEAFGF